MSGGGILALPAALYAWAMRRRNRRFDRPGMARRVPLPVVSVGNLTVGGAGKTPTVAWLARRLVELGRRPAIVSRGYGGNVGTGPVVVSDGGATLRGGPRRVGDEPWLLARSLRGTAVVVGADRVAGAHAAAECGADVVVLDDGFQHRRLARDLDVVLLDATAPFGNGRVLPAGPLREPAEGLRRADVVILTRAAPGDGHDDSRRAVARHAPTVPVLLARHRPSGFVDAEGRAAPAPARAVAFCGIAVPDSFRASLAEAGVEVDELITFRDHHRYRPRDLARLGSLARACGAPLVTTEKDLARLDGGPALEPPPLALRVEIALRDPQPLLAAVRRAVGEDDV